MSFRRLSTRCKQTEPWGFITKLKEELKRAEDDHAQQLKIALAALDTTQEDSLLNQLRRDTAQARTDLLQAINPDREGSPLASIKAFLREQLDAHAKSTKEQLEEARRQSAEFQRDVRDAVQRLETRRREAQRSARGGGLFEDAVAEFVQHELGRSGYIVDTTGNVVGLRPNCKVGDVVIQFPPDHAFAGHKVVIEAKRDKSYSLSKALDEVINARKNRDAGAGIIVMARSHAPRAFPASPATDRTSLWSGTTKIPARTRTSRAPLWLPSRWPPVTRPPPRRAICKPCKTSNSAAQRV